MTFHIPVMADESVNFLDPQEGKTIVDCTLGGAGHTLKLKSQNSKVKIIGIDRDIEAIEAAKERLKAYSDITYIHGDFGALKKHILEPVDGFLFDLGVSSHQIDQPERGFSFRSDAPLDMRMGREVAGSQVATARNLINELSVEELTNIFKEYGEERFSGRIARAIVKQRESTSIETTFQLKEIVEKAIPTWKKRESVARIFQALRIAVNQELDQLKQALVDCVPLLKPGGRIVVISYHSLEDRIVKWFFREQAKDGILKIITKRPVLASSEETEQNSRAKSAKLRAAEKI